MDNAKIEEINKFFGQSRHSRITLDKFIVRNDMDFDNSVYINHAIDFLSNSGGGIINLPSGTIWIKKSIVLKTDVKLCGVGMGATILKMADNCNQTVVKSENFDDLTGTSEWNGDKVPKRFGIESLCVDGNKKGSTEESNGVEFYGKRYLIEDITIVDCKGIGLYSECSSKGGQPMDWNALPEANIKSLWISGCNREGMIFRGPHDTHIGEVMVNGAASLPDVDAVRFEWKGGVYDGACDINMIHAYQAKGRGIYTECKIKANFLIGDSCWKEGIYIDNPCVQIGMVELFKNNFRQRPYETESKMYPNITITKRSSAIIGNMVVRDDYFGGGVLCRGNLICNNLEILTGFYDVRSDPSEKKEMKRGEVGITLDNASDVKITGVIKNFTAGISLKNLKQSSLDLSFVECDKLGDLDDSVKQNNVQLVSTNKCGKLESLVNRLSNT